MTALADIPWVTAWTQLISAVLTAVELGILIVVVYAALRLRGIVRAKISKLDSALDKAAHTLELAVRVQELAEKQRGDTTRVVGEAKAVVGEAKAAVDEVRHAVAAGSPSESGTTRTPPLPPLPPG